MVMCRVHFRGENVEHGGNYLAVESKFIISMKNKSDFNLVMVVIPKMFHKT